MHDFDTSRFSLLTVTAPGGKNVQENVIGQGRQKTNDEPADRGKCMTAEQMWGCSLITVLVIGSIYAFVSALNYV